MSAGGFRGQRSGQRSQVKDQVRGQRSEIQYHRSEVTVQSRPRIRDTKRN